MSPLVVCLGGVVWESIFQVDRIPGAGIKLLPRAARRWTKPWGRLGAPSWDEVQARLATVGSPTAAAFTTQA